MIMVRCFHTMFQLYFAMNLCKEILDTIGNEKSVKKAATN